MPEGNGYPISYNAGIDPMSGMTARTWGRADGTIGLWLYGVSFRTAIQLCAILVRRLLFAACRSNDALRLSFVIHDRELL